MALDEFELIMKWHHPLSFWTLMKFSAMNSIAEIFKQLLHELSFLVKFYIILKSQRISQDVLTPAEQEIVSVSVSSIKQSQNVSLLIKAVTVDLVDHLLQCSQQKVLHLVFSGGPFFETR